MSSPEPSPIAESRLWDTERKISEAQCASIITEMQKCGFTEIPATYLTDIQSRLSTMTDEDLQKNIRDLETVHEIYVFLRKKVTYYDGLDSTDNSPNKLKAKRMTDAVNTIPSNQRASRHADRIILTALNVTESRIHLRDTTRAKEYQARWMDRKKGSPDDEATPTHGPSSGGGR